MKALILDSEAISQLARGKSGRAKTLYSEAVNNSVLVAVPAAVLAEQFRGGKHDQVLQSFLARNRWIAIYDTDIKLAQSIGHLLAKAQLGSEHHVDGAVVATALDMGGGVILTSDPNDLERIAAGHPAIKIIPL